MDVVTRIVLQKILRTHSLRIYMLTTIFNVSMPLALLMQTPVNVEN